MAYVGTPIDTQNQFQSLQGKRFSGDASTTAFTLDIAPSSVFDIEVFVENVRQDPNSAYGVSGTTLTFTGAPPSGTNNIYVVHQAKAVGTIDVPASGVVPASLASNIISGQTALAVEPADTDEFLVSDAGTIKRIDYSLIKSKGKVGQVVQHLQTAIFTLSAQNTYTDVTGFTANITPTATSSKILVRVFGGVNHSTASSELYRLKLLRGSTAIGVVNDSTDHFWQGYGNSNTPYNFSAEILDSPSSTSQQTYKMQAFDTGSGTNVYVGGYSNAYNTLTGMTLTEILA